MSQLLLQALEDLLSIEGRSLSLKRLATDTKSLSDFFTSERDELKANYFNDPGLRDAYIATYFPMNAAKVFNCLTQALEMNALPDTTPLRVLDLGSGPGTAAIASSIFLSQIDSKRIVDFLLVEENGAMAREAVSITNRIQNKNHFFEVKTEHISRRHLYKILGDQKFDIILAANLLNEFEDENDAEKLAKACATDFLKDDGLLIVIDPALKESARSLMRLRDRIVHSTDMGVMAPCLHQKECPMLAANERDWCHFYIEWERPELIRQLDDLTGLDHTHLKMAYLILQTNFEGRGTTAPSGSSDEGRKTWRVVSSPLKSKGKIEIVLCGDNGELLKVMRLDRDGSEANAAMDTIMRGDIISCPAQKRIGKDARIQIIRRWL